MIVGGKILSSTGFEVHEQGCALNGIRKHISIGKENSIFKLNQKSYHEFICEKNDDSQKTK